MKKLNKVAVLFASAALAAPIAGFAQSKAIDNWRASDGTVWKNGTNELCWRDAGWTPATADLNSATAPSSRRPARRRPRRVLRPRPRRRLLPRPPHLRLRPSPVPRLPRRPRRSARRSLSRLMRSSISPSPS
jgi:OOP family OmpA-OmpF porin